MKQTASFAGLVLISMFSTGLVGAQDEGVYAAKTKDGYLFIWNQPAYFTMELKGKEVLSLILPGHFAFSVDSVGLEIECVAVSKFLKSNDQGSSPTTTLTAYRDWQSKDTEETLGQKLTVKSSTTKLANGDEALLWEYEFPREIPGPPLRKYATLVNGKDVVVLNASCFPGANADQVERLLVQTLGSLKRSPKPIDLQQFKEAK